MTFLESEVYCQMMGANLAEILDIELFNILKFVTEQKPGKHFWVGATDLLEVKKLF